MRIGIDARIACYSGSGIARYTRGLVRGLQSVAAKVPDIELEILTARRQTYPFPVSPPLQERRLSTPPHFRWERHTLPLELGRANLNLLHSTDFFTPHRPALRAICTVMDLFFARSPEQLSPDSRRHYLQIFEWLPRAAHIIAISEFTRAEILELTDVKKERVSVIYPGCDPLPRAAPHAVAEIRRRYDLPNGCILFVGTIEARKNIPVMVQAYLEASHQRNGQLPPFVIVGKEGFHGDDIRARCEKMAGKAPIYFVGELSDLELSALYSTALALLYVTAGEGFGFPIVEAMHAGVPVITSASSACAEIGANTALLVNHQSPSEIAAALLKLHGSRGEQERLRSAGYLRAKQFSWGRCVDELLELYRELSGDAMHTRARSKRVNGAWSGYDGE